MSDPLIFVITNAGRAALINAANTGTGAVTVTQIGVSATAVVANAGMTALAGEIKRLATFGGSGVADDTIHVTLRDETTDAYSLRSFGLYLSDGTLFGLYGQPDPISDKTANSLILLSADIKLADIAAATIEFGSTDFQNPPATETVMGVLSLATNAEASAGTVPNKAITPKTLAFALAAYMASNFSDVWRASNDGAGSGLDAGLLAGQLPAYYTNIVARLGYTPANLAGDLFTGPIRRDAGYYMHMLGTDPILNFDVNDFIQYDRTNNALSLYIGGVLRFAVTTGGVNIAGNTAWHSGNDGAGSGLDAGLLAGQAPSYYTAISARLGYTPANKAGDTFSGPVGYGDSAHYVALNGGVNPLYAWDAGDYMIYDRATNVLSLVIGGGARFSLSSTALSLYGGTAWHSGNDGAGSGLDAGLLGGQTPDYYQQNALNVRSLELGQNLAGDGVAYLDLHASAGTDFNTRIIREPGVNGNMSVVQTGTGLFELTGGSNLTRNGNTVWHAGNDGAGSGLDAGLLAGQAPAYYTDIVARLGYTPLNQSYYTAADVLAKLVTVDGSGSSVDADLLDGQHGSYYLPGGNYTANDVKTKLVSVDGSGSGIDADLLDGLQAAAFVQKSSIMTDFAAAMALSWAGAFGPNSFYLGNLLVQMGIASTIAANGSAVINFPTHFSAAPFVIPFRRTSGAVQNADSGAGIEGTPTISQAVVRNTTAGAVIDILWIAIGPA